MLVYDRDKKGKWQQSVINDSMGEGDRILRVDLDGDGTDEFITFHGRKGPGKYKNRVVWWKFSPVVPDVAIQPTVHPTSSAPGR